MRRIQTIRPTKAKPERGAVVAFRSLEVLEGEMDARALREAREWAAAHRDELLAVWEGFKA